MLNDTDFVKYVAENYSYLVAEAVRKLEAMSVDAYLALVRDHYGDEVLGDLLAALSEDLLFAQKFVLNEHHLYGSSRLGVKTHKRVLLRKEFSISGFEEDGTYIVDEVTDSLVYVRSEVYFCRVLAQKQYELSNHLGNVLATVLDRRTGVFDEGEDTLMYYVADVVSATLYYPFGQAMLSYSNEEFNYSFGMNTQEKEDDVFEGAYSAEYWMYDSRLGRRWNNDPRPNPSISVYACFRNNPIWFSDIYGDSIDVKFNQVLDDDGNPTGVINVEVTYTGKVLNNSSEEVDMSKVISGIESEFKRIIENKNIEFGNGITWNITSVNVNMELVTSMDEVNPSDHLLVFVDEVHSSKQGNAIGIASLKGKIAYTEMSGFTPLNCNSKFQPNYDQLIKVSVHEILHNFGLDDMYNDPIDKQIPGNYMLKYGTGKSGMGDKPTLTNNQILTLLRATHNQGSNSQSEKKQRRKKWFGTSNYDPQTKKSTGKNGKIPKAIN
ncbi:MAG: hypothetical protein M9892_07435 [Bacteroidetes bacterium]|nr:hypothetical protein [Bacteroidota bacterium]